MRARQIGGVLPVLLLVGGIAAPLGVADLAGSDGGASAALGVRLAPAPTDAPLFLRDAANLGGCTLTEGGAVTLGTTPADLPEPYARPVAEGAAPIAPRAEIAKPVAAPTVLGTRLRVGEPLAVAMPASSCAPERDDRASHAARAPFKT